MAGSADVFRYPARGGGLDEGSMIAGRYLRREDLAFGGVIRVL